MSIVVRYVDSPPNVALPTSIYSRLVEKASNSGLEIVNDPKAHVDLEMVSVHAPELVRLTRTLASVRPGKGYRGRLRKHERWNSVYREPSARASRSVWFTGDNVRPPGGAWDGFLSFDLDSLSGRNAYFPHWWEYLGLWSSDCASYSGVELSVPDLLSPRVVAHSRKKFACAFIGNPTAMRLHAIEALSRVGQVDVYGNSAGRPVASKVDVATDYRFVLCFENDLYPGYVTEKVFEAWATGAVPLWWGSDPAGYVNGNAVMNAADFPSLADFAEAVAIVNSDSLLWSELAGMPILTREPDLKPSLRLMSRVLG